MVIKMAVGINRKQILSNLMVKSKSPLQPSTAGPIDSSFTHPENSITVYSMYSVLGRGANSSRDTEKLD